MTRTRVLVIVVTLVAAVLASRLRLSPDLSALFPDRGSAAALTRYTRAFAGGDAAPILIRGHDPRQVEEGAACVTEALRGEPSVLRVVDEASVRPSLQGEPAARSVDPTAAWVNAGPRARRALARALTPEGMDERLAETRALLLAPGAAHIEGWIRADPLRLRSLPFEGGDHRTPSFVADGGHARLVLAQPRGTAFVSADAGAFVAATERAFEACKTGREITFAATGGHAIAHATEKLLRRDLMVSSALATVLTALVFAVAFGRARALLAVLPPLGLGTLWTLGLAALVPGGLSAIAIGFSAVVVGVGVDTGVHVYGALLDGRRRGLSPEESARAARHEATRPTLVAAFAAACAFASLAMSQVSGLGQLGLLCGAGELLTAVAILVFTPTLGAYLEKGRPPAPRSSLLTRGLVAATRTRRRATVILGCAAIPLLALPVVGWPPIGDAVVALRPSGLAPLGTQEVVERFFGNGGRPWIVLHTAADLESAAARADALAEALEGDGTKGLGDDAIHVEALATLAPAASTVRARIAARDALDLPGRASSLELALRRAGFDVDAFTPALGAFAHPTPAATLVDSGESSPSVAVAFARARHLARDGQGALAVLYLRVPPGSEERVAAAVHGADPTAIVTGYGHLEAGLRETLASDLPRITAVALLVVTLALGAALRSVRDVLLVLSTVALELAALGVVMRLADLRWHVYDALVVPVLLGITLDEAMFLLFEVRRGRVPHLRSALARQAPRVLATALTTAAGFAALLACRFQGLRDLGALGAVGVLLGLGAALLTVPAALRLILPPSSLERARLDRPRGIL